MLSFLRFFFRSGNIEHPGDKLFNTTVEVLPFDVSPFIIFQNIKKKKCLMLDFISVHYIVVVVVYIIMFAFQNIQAEKEALTEGKEKTPKFHRTEDGFYRIGLNCFLLKLWCSASTLDKICFVMFSVRPNYFSHVFVFPWNYIKLCTVPFYVLL